eukprot:814406-Pleurochrysis_carterae.AAC.1
MPAQPAHRPAAQLHTSRCSRSDGRRLRAHSRRTAAERAKRRLRPCRPWPFEGQAHAMLSYRSENRARRLARARQQR